MVFGRQLLVEAPLHASEGWEWVMEGGRSPRSPLHQGMGLAPGPHNWGHSVMGAKLLRASRELDRPLLSPGQREEDGDPRSWHKPATEGPDPAAQGPRTGPQPCHHPPQNTTGPNPVPTLVAAPALSHRAPTWHPAPINCPSRGIPTSTCWHRVG